MNGNDPGPESKLLGRLAGDLDGHFESVVRLYQDRLYAFALRLSDSAEDAEEIAQDALVRAYRALQGYPPERIARLALRPWLYQITLNVFRNHVRARQPATMPLDGASDDDGDDGDWEPAADEVDRPEVRAEHAELQAEIAGLVAALPEPYRAAVLLRFMAGLSYADLAEVLGVPLGTAKSNVHRGVRRLRAQMSAAPQSVR